jgi:hypothetical protein
MRYLSFLFLKLRYLKFFGLLAICLGVGLFSASNANAQRVTFGVGIGAPVYYGSAPVCTYGYYDYSPYDCAPYGYYGPDWFVGGVFIGAGPWYHSYYGRGYGRGYGYRGGYRYYGHGGYGRGFDRGYRGGDFHGGNGYRGGGNYRGGAEFHGGAGGYRGGGNFHGGGGGYHGGGSGGSFHGGGHGGGGRH